MPTKSKTKRQPFAYVAAMAILVLAVAVVATVTSASTAGSARTALVQASSFKIGEKLTYSVSFGKLQNAMYAETHVVSRGKLAGKDAVEIRARIKTRDLISAAFFMFDERRTVFAAPDNGLPLYIRTLSNDRAIPKETTASFIEKPTINFDLVTLLYKIRDAGGAGTYTLAEGESTYTVTFLSNAAEKVRTEAGEFDTVVSTVQSEYLAANGIKELKINLSTDENRFPVLVRVKSDRGDFRAALTAAVLPEPETPTPTPTATPVVIRTPVPRATPTPDPYVDNAPLAPELGFQIGESLEYHITSGGKAIGNIRLAAVERKRFNGADSLLLSAAVIGVEPDVTEFKLGDTLIARVDPETLAPTMIEAKMATPFPGMVTSATFDPRTGNIKFSPTDTVEAPIGTQSLLSLVYSMRSFNLKPSKNRSNPVNDTRVAVFWETRPHIFTLRPSEPAEITLGGNKMPAQLIAVNTGSALLDKPGLKIWLGAESRVPLRFTLGSYQADLIIRNATIFR